MRIALTTLSCAALLLGCGAEKKPIADSPKQDCPQGEIFTEGKCQVIMPVGFEKAKPPPRP